MFFLHQYLIDFTYKVQNACSDYWIKFILNWTILWLTIARELVNLLLMEPGSSWKSSSTHTHRLLSLRILYLNQIQGEVTHHENEWTHDFGLTLLIDHQRGSWTWKTAMIKYKILRLSKYTSVLLIWLDEAIEIRNSYKDAGTKRMEYQHILWI